MNCEQMLLLYTARLNIGDKAGAMEICKRAASQGCKWPYTVGCYKYMDDGEDGDFYNGPIIDRGNFWPPCPTPWGPGPRLKAYYVPDPIVGRNIEDPRGI
jgi:hypothetical protein